MFFAQGVPVANRVMMALDADFALGRFHNAGRGKRPWAIGKDALCLSGLRETPKESIHFIELEHRPVRMDKLSIESVSLYLITLHGLPIPTSQEF